MTNKRVLGGMKTLITWKGFGAKRTDFRASDHMIRIESGDNLILRDRRHGQRLLWRYS